MNIELGDGQQAELRERLTYAQGREVRRAKLAAEVDPVMFAEFDIALVRAYVVSWVVIGVDGVAVALADAEIAPDDVIQPIALAALKLWNGKPDPKRTAASSGSTSRARSLKSVAS